MTKYRIDEDKNFIPEPEDIDHGPWPGVDFSMFPPKKKPSLEERA